LTAAGRPTWPPEPGGTWVVDLDGVIWLTGQPIPGAADAIARLRRAGDRVLFATNNSAPTRAELNRGLARCGITADDRDLLSSADVAAGMLVPSKAFLRRRYPGGSGNYRTWWREAVGNIN